MSYLLHHRVFMGKDVYIVCSDGDSTSIVALCNYLILRTPDDQPRNIRFPKKDVKKISKNELIELWRHLCALALQRKGIHSDAVSDFLCNIEYLFEDTGLVPSHIQRSTNFNTDVNYGDDGNVIITTPMLLFTLSNYLEVNIRHGWLIDREPESAFLLEAYSSEPPNESQRDARNAFKSSSDEDQLTAYGLRSLATDVKDGDYALLSRRNNLTLVQMYHGHLIELETNNNVWNVIPGVMWKTLTVPARHGVFLSCDYSSTKVQLNSNVVEVVAFLDKWEESEAAIKSALEKDLFDDSEDRKGGKGKKKKKKHVSEDLPGGVGANANSGGAGASGAPLPQTSTSTASEAEPGGPTVDEYEGIRTQWTRFLNGFIDEDDDFPEGVTKIFYARRIKEFLCIPRRERSLRFVVHYPHIEKYDASLAFAILNDQNRLNSVLREEFVKFCEENNFKSKPDLQKLRLLIDNLPPAECIPQSFCDFLKSKKIQLSRRSTVFTGTIDETLVHASYIGRLAGKGYFDQVLEQHADGKSFDGEISLSDLAVKNGRFVILKPATVTVNKDRRGKDLTKLTHELFPLYQIDRDYPFHEQYMYYVIKHHPEGQGYVNHLLDQDIHWLQLEDVYR